MTKEECLEALNYLASWQCVYCWKTHGAETDIEYQESKQLLKQLINEHFDNPPLTLEELERMQDEPIWDDWAKEWLIFNWNCDSLECLLCRDSLGNWLHLDFEENRFYRKQVE